MGKIDKAELDALLEESGVGPRTRKKITAANDKAEGSGSKSTTRRSSSTSGHGSPLAVSAPPRTFQCGAFLIQVDEFSTNKF